MSAIHDRSGNANENGAVRIYHTKIKVVVHSHLTTDPIDLSDDVVNINFGKHIKGTGQANITLSPRMNYLNNLGPNDYVNAYIDRSDGYGWTRVFFGLVDRIDESYTVNDRGNPTTLYSLSCSDFGKMFDKSQYYTNPSIVGRDDVFTREIGNPFASVALYSNGLLIAGCPSDVVSQIAISLVGFSGQFTLPDSYALAVKNSTLVGENRALRMNLAQSLMNPVAVANLPNGGLLGIAQEAARLGDLSAATDSFAQGSTGTPDLLAAATAMGVNPEHLPDHLRNNPTAVRDFVASQHITRTLTGIEGFNNGADLFGSRERSTINIITSAIPGTPRNLLSLINLGTFVERRAIDGYTHGLTIPNNDIAIVNLLRSYSNEFVNELFFDLRPVSATSDGFAIGTNWSTDPDELGENDTGVRYVPSMIMREYPFSTIDSIDGRNVELHLKDAQGKTITYKDFQFGAIFSDGPNVPGRHIITIPSINISDKIVKKGESTNDRAQKHIDVATIHSTEIIRSTFSRSDTDVVNLIELTTEGSPGHAANQFMINLLPIVTPIHIRRHGLRVKSDSTRYARPNLGVAEPSATSTSQGSQPQAGTPTGTGTLTSPMVVSHSQQNRGYVLHSNRCHTTRWGFVREKDGGTKVRMHHGVDIFARPGTPVYAIMDGTVELAAENGSNQSNNTYGNTIVIKHPGGGVNGEDVWSVYAHLGQPKFISGGRRNRNFDESTPEKSTGMLVRKGDTVSAGQHIGFCGWTAGAVKPGNPQWYSECGIRRLGEGTRASHVHFEILRKINSRRPFPAMGSTNPDDYPEGQKNTLPPFTYSQNILDTISSVDPVQFFQAKANMDLVAAVGGGAAIPDDPEDDDVTDDQPDAVTAHPPERDESTPQNDAPASPANTSNLDGATVQHLVGRWGLLLDHWYQHNPEYLSGTIDMRGAPEIRVGYRLDIVDRNMSFYVEGVSHKWQYPGVMTTTLTVTRGQPNNPYPAYIFPRTSGFGGGASQRDMGSRLGQFFLAPDPASVRHAMVIRSSSVGRPVFSSDTNDIDTDRVLSQNSGETYKVAVSETVNEVDITEALGHPDLLGTDLTNTNIGNPLDEQVPSIFGVNPGGIRNV